jgi:hypothetical protein
VLEKVKLIFKVTKSIIAGLGVIARECVPNRSVFGPYQGEYLSYESTTSSRIEQAESGSRAFEVLKDSGAEETIGKRTDIIFNSFTNFFTWKMFTLGYPRSGKIRL